MTRGEAIEFAQEQQEIFGGRMGEFLKFVEDELSQTNASNTLNALDSVDLIRRQAAIDALGERPLVWDEYTDEYELGQRNQYDSDKAAIETVPSAQPEQRWTPVSEKPPEETGTYITTIDYGEYGLVTGQRYYHGGVRGWNDECVIAWMPLPKPWKGE